MAGFKTPRRFTRGETVNVDVGSLEQDLYQVSLATDIVDARAFGGLDDVVIAPTKEQMITSAISYAAATGKSKVYIPKSMMPYDPTQVTFNSSIRLVTEGSNWTDFDVTAYGAAGDGVTNDTPAFKAAIGAAEVSNRRGNVLVPSPPGGGPYILGPTGAMSGTSCIVLAAGVKLYGTGGMGGDQPTMQLANNCNLSMIEVVGTSTGCAIQNLRLNGNSANQTATSYGIHGLANGSNYVDSRLVLRDMYVEFFRNEGYLFSAQFSAVSLENCRAFNCGKTIVDATIADGFQFGGTDCRGFNIQSGNNTGSGIQFLNGNNFFWGGSCFSNAQWNLRFAGSGQYAVCNTWDLDRAGLDNVEIDANNVRLENFNSNDPGQSATATYSHVRVGVVGTATGIHVINGHFRALSGKGNGNTAVCTIRVDSAGNSNCVFDQRIYESGCATSGVLCLPGSQTTILRPAAGNMTLTNAGATPSVAASNQFNQPTFIVLTQTGATNVTNFTNGYDGQVITIFAGDSNSTIVNGASIQLNGGVNFAMSINATLTLGLTGGIWREIARKA